MGKILTCIIFIGFIIYIYYVIRRQINKIKKGHCSGVCDKCSINDKSCSSIKNKND